MYRGGAVLAVCTILAGMAGAKIVMASPRSNAVSAERRIVSPVDLAALADIAGLSVSPDGKLVAFQVQRPQPAMNSYQSEWMIAAIDGTARVWPVGDAGTPHIENVYGRPSGNRTTIRPSWSPDGQWIAYVRDTVTEAKLWRARSDGRRAEPIPTFGKGDIVRFAWSSDGESLIYELNLFRHEKERQRLAEERTGFLLDERFDPWYSANPSRISGSRVAPVFYQKYSLRSREFGEPVADDTQKLALEDQPYLLAHRAQSTATFETERTTLPHGAKSPIEGRDIHLLAIHASGRVAWAQPEDEQTSGSYQNLVVAASVQRSNIEKVVPCVASECHGRIAELFWTPDGTRVVFTRWEGWANSEFGIYVWDVSKGNVHRVITSSDMFVDCSILNEVAVCFHEGPLQPRRLISLNLTTAAIDVIFDPNPTWADHKLCPADRLQYRDEFGNEAFGYYVRPCLQISHRASPLVIVGYRASGFLRGGVGDEYPVQVLAQSGMGVFVYDAPEDRSMDASFGDDEREDHAWENFRERRSSWSAIKGVIALLVQKGDVDSNAIGITGLSDAAETVSWALVHGGQFAAAIVSTPTWDPIHFYLTGSRSLIRGMPRWGLGPLESENAGSWKEMSVALNQARIKTPILANLADHEFIRYMQTHATLKYFGRPVETYIHPDEYHVKWQPAHRLAIYQRNADWLNFWLRGVVDSDQGKLDQYARWETLKAERDRLLQPNYGSHQH